MPSALLRQLDAVRDYDTLGESVYGDALGLANTDGIAIADPAGGHLLERRDVYGPYPHFYGVGFATSGATTVWNMGTHPHAASEAYQDRKSVV